MDPLSITASICAILQLTSTLTSYINDAKNTTKEQAQLAIEASNLYTLLTTLRFRVNEARSDDPWLNQIRLLGMKNGPLDQFKDILETMVEQASSFRKRDQIKSAVLWKFTRQNVENTLARMERLKLLANCALTNDLTTLSKAIQGDVVAIREQNKRLQSRTDAIHDDVIIEQRNRLSQWLRLPDPSTNYHTALQKRHPETGLWLLNGQDFRDWKSSTSLMWLHGNAGCGKTLLSAAALQHILEHQQSHPDIIMVSYFYFDFNDTEKQSWQNAVRSLLFQLALQCSDILQDLEKLYQNCGKGQWPTSGSAIQSLYREVVARPGQKYIMLDALDECTDRKESLIFLREMMNSTPDDLHVLATSRPEKDIEDKLSSITTHNINVQSALVNGDICVYICDRVATDETLRKWPSSVQDEIATKLIKHAGGMFRWVDCQFDSIQQCVKLSTLRKTLSSLPKTLDETYDRILQTLEPTPHFQDAVKALRWLCFSERPLQLAEMAEVLAIENGNEGGFFPEERLPDPRDVMVICSSLITLNSIENEEDKNHAQDSGVENRCHIRIQLAHFSVKEFLLSDRCGFGLDFRPQICHLMIAEGCLHYLLHLSQNKPLAEEVIKEYPLASYAAKHWWQHVQNIGGMLNDTLLDLVLCLLTDEDTTLHSWIQLYEIDRPWRGSQLCLRSNEIAQPLYYAAYIGVPEIVERIIKRNVDVNAQGGEYGNALQAASAGGHDNVVKMLVEAGADVNVQGGSYGNALHAASEGGYETVVKTLIDAGADVNAQGGRYALRAASKGGHDKVVKMLISAGGDVNAQGGEYGNALHAALEGGYEIVVKMLIDAGADVNARKGFYGNALQGAAVRGHDKVVKMLLDAGADVNAQGGYYGNALYAASGCGCDKAVKMLVEAGADVNAQGGRYGNALQGATVRGHDKVMKMLIDAGADVNAQGGYYGNALYAASKGGRDKVVKTLIDAGADVNAQGGYYGNALYAALEGGYETVVKMLIDAGGRC
ncbi:uncharacterized protein Z518_11285 [Rhinocladiella mackenziei CBS 650.93]|uniref:NACHT domain-containing protein n=1 Tax=Rhinocladiella mackenziei CBS 650.93 TaxID=1442369 RepID=A0A0D2FBT1_9EURO|nr:uncharacterized protein Z518_11285 [Rhinocladiella mackenziei CBS 650.93]KIW99546.1 hypothetical protein Z518_11285 [Rhinocladiella mackenziei CBS 650.93]